MVGDSLPGLEKVITQEQLRTYADASDDHNPLHLDPEFAASTQFGSTIAHGMLTLAFLYEMLTLAYGQGWLEGGRLKMRFKGPAYPGDRVRTWGKVVKQETGNGLRSIECAIGLSNGRGEELVRGTAFITQPD